MGGEQRCRWKTHAARAAANSLEGCVAGVWLAPAWMHDLRSMNQQMQIDWSPSMMGHTAPH